MRKRQVFAAVAVALTLAGCGARPESGSTTNNSPANDSKVYDNAQELVRAATTQTEKVKSAAFTMEYLIAGQTITGQGAGQFDPDNGVMRMTMNVGHLTEELRYVDKTMYFQFPQEYRAQLTSGKPWGKLDPNSDMANTMNAASQAKQSDPSQILQQINEAGLITRHEEETLDGKPVSHYWIDVDFAKALDKFKGIGLDEAQLNQLATKVKAVPVQLWLDRELLPVQVREDMTALMAASGAPENMQNMSMTLKYTAWGVPVDVQAPPADQVGKLKLPTN